MMPMDLIDPALSQVMDQLRKREETFAVATIVRTAGITSAKPGAKALLRADGTILQGWLGGGCLREAVKTAALTAYSAGRPQLISVAPQDALSDKGVQAGDSIDGVSFAQNGCPSQGTIDVFIEPCFPQPEVLIFGNSPVAEFLATLCPQFGWDVTALAADAPLPTSSAARSRYQVIATQGQGDLAALKTALAAPSEYVSFVGSRKKYAALSAKLCASGIAPDTLASVYAPAGLNLGAVTPEEIALSIMAQITQLRRQRLVQDSRPKTRSAPP